MGPLQECWPTEPTRYREVVLTCSLFATRSLKLANKRRPVGLTLFRMKLHTADGSLGDH